MSLNYRQRHRLRLVKAGLRRSDPLLCAMFGMFGGLYKGDGMPAWEQVPTSPDRGRIAAWGATVLAAMAAVFSAARMAAVVAVTAMRRPPDTRQLPCPSALRMAGTPVSPRAHLGTASRAAFPGARRSGRRWRPACGLRGTGGRQTPRACLLPGARRRQPALARSDATRSSTDSAT